jgi:hypothetical protein
MYWDSDTRTLQFRIPGKWVGSIPQEMLFSGMELIVDLDDLTTALITVDEHVHLLAYHKAVPKPGVHTEPNQNEDGTIGDTGRFL